MRFIVILIMFFPLIGISQDSQEEPIKDNSKPTNVYSQIDNFLQFDTNPDFNTFGYNPRISYAPNADNSLVLEVPLLYSTKTNKFGLSDIRLRYFFIPYRDYTKFIGSFGTSIDIIVPTGKFEDGLGSSSWRVSPGVIIGLILNESQTISIFPNLSYIYTTKPTTDLIPDNLKENDHGINFRIISSFVLSNNAFFLVTPIYDVKDIDDVKEDSFQIELETVFDILKDKYQVGTFYKGNFLHQTHTFSLYFTVFL